MFILHFFGHVFWNDGRTVGAIASSRNAGIPDIRRGNSRAVLIPTVLFPPREKYRRGFAHGGMIAADDYDIWRRYSPMNMARLRRRRRERRVAQKASESKFHVGGFILDFSCFVFTSYGKLGNH